MKTVATNNISALLRRQFWRLAAAPLAMTLYLLISPLLHESQPWISITLVIGFAVQVIMLLPVWARIGQISDNLQSYGSGHHGHVAQARHGILRWMQNSRIGSEDPDLANLVYRLRRLVNRSERQQQHLQRQQQSLTAIIDSIPIVVIGVDHRGQVNYFNRSATQVLSTLEQGRDIRQLIRDPDFISNLEEVLETRSISPQLQHSIAGPPARHFTLEIHPASAVSTATGASAPSIEDRAIIVMLETTAMVETETLRQEFVSNVSHELRTPLTSIVGFIEMLLEDGASDPQQQKMALGIMQEQSGRMVRLIRDQLSLSRIEQREYRPPTETEDFADIINTVLPTLEQQAEERKVRLEKQLPGKPVKIIADRDEISQVVQNLVENAIRYGRQGGRVRIDLAARAETLPLNLRQTGLNYARMDITDDGEGIDPVHIPRLTERFYRIDTNRSRANGGTGLGLAIVKHITRRHRGHLAIHSVRDEGSTFSVFIPGSD